MKFTELKNSIAEGAQSVYLLQGVDAYFRSKGEEMIKEAFLQFPELNYASFDGETLKGSAIGEMVTALKNYPFMAEKRLVKVSEFYPAEGEFNTYLKPLFEDFPSTSILIIVNSQSKKGVDLKRKNAVTYVDCNKAEPETVARWIYLTLKRAGITCAADVCEKIAAWCVSDMARVSVEVEKLITYKGSGELTDEEAEALVYKDADYRVYQMTNAVAAGNYTAYAEISRELRSKGYDELAIMNSFLSFYRNMLSASSSPLGNAQYAERNSMNEYSVKKYREQAKRIGTEEITRLCAKTYSLISDVKSGVTTPPTALKILESMIFFS